MIDKDPEEYTVEKLHEWKKQAEENARIILHKMPEEADKTSATDTPVIETIDDSHRSKKQFTIDISVDDNRKIINESELKRNLLLFMSLEEEMDIQVNVESSQGTAFTELYERIQNKLNNGEALTEAEEKNFKDIIRGKRRNEVVNKRHKIACELFLRDTKVLNVYCSELKDYLFILSGIVGYDPALLCSPNHFENAGICFKLMQSNKREFHFIAYIPRETLKNMGMSAETWTGEIMLKDIYSFDYDTVKRILVYFYLDLAWEAIQRDPDILTDKRALNIGNYMPFPN
ncbi:hypothetical protein [Butyrivibrio sp. JL13D10]|uniref:hypothetical protein n=1 Tax=Butyrivibrio sp. JL13D10 TaxID=3236815 RepID=UPI0038B5917B